MADTEMARKGKFNDATEVEQVVWRMKLVDYDRGRNRAMINRLMNGASPYTDDEAKANNITTNVNFLEGNKIAHDARRQLHSGLISPDPSFTVSLDYGPVWRRREWGDIITKQLNKIRKKSLVTFENDRSEIASLVLHGIAPSAWRNSERWCADSMGVEDVLIPSNTLLTLENLPFFAIYRKYTAMQFIQMTQGPVVDPGWDKGMVAAVINWIDAQSKQLMGTQWPEVWSPEKLEERIKSDGGLYASDAVPTVDCYDFYFWHDDGETSGWHRRMILDAWGEPGAGGMTLDRKPDQEFSKGKFLFNPGSRNYADKLQNILQFQFADGSCVAPFRYHSVRSLGFLLYSVCHLQNRIRCKLSDATFEAAMQYFRVNNPDDAERVIKLNLIDKGVIPEGVEFMTQEQRWKVDQALFSMFIESNRQTMADNSASFTQDFDLGKKDAGETATRTMAKVNATAALVGAMLDQAYAYRKFKYLEECRRFCIKDSKDADVREFRVEALKRGVPEEALNVSAWDVQPTRVIGNGNKMLQVAIADKLMAIRPQLDPEAQKKVDRLYIVANSEDYALADDLVPQQPHVSDSIHDAELAFGTLMVGVPVTPKPGLNAAEVAGKVLELCLQKESQILQSGGMGTPQDVVGLTLASQYAGAFIAMLAQDKNEKQAVKQLNDILARVQNQVKAFSERQAEAAQKAQEQGGGDNGEAQAKIEAMQMQAQVKAQNARESHAEKTAQRQIAFEQQQQQNAERHQLEMQKEQQRAALEMQKAQQQAAMAAQKPAPQSQE